MLLMYLSPIPCFINGFYIYRLYELDDERNCGKLYIQKRSLSVSYKLEPKVYLAHFQGDEKEDNSSMRSH